MLNKQTGSLIEHKDSIKENEGVEFLVPNQVENINPDEDGKFGNSVNSNGESKFVILNFGITLLIYRKWSINSIW